MNIIVYTKTKCPWAMEVIAFLQANKIPFEERDMYKNSKYKDEVIAKSGQFKSPTLDIDGHILPDSDVKQVKKYLLEIGILKAN